MHQLTIIMDGDGVITTITGATGRVRTKPAVSAMTEAIAIVYPPVSAFYTSLSDGKAAIRPGRVFEPPQGEKVGSTNCPAGNCPFRVALGSIQKFRYVPVLSLYSAPTTRISC
jgi:hypothetical protein